MGQNACKLGHLRSELQPIRFRLRLWGACSYSVSANGVLGPQTTYLTDKGGQVCDLVQGVIAPGGKSVAGGDYDWCGYDHSVVARWGYPGGGNPTKEYIGAEPVGAAISAMPN